MISTGTNYALSTNKQFYNDDFSIAFLVYYILLHLPIRRKAKNVLYKNAHFLNIFHFQQKYSALKKWINENVFSIKILHFENFSKQNSNWRTYSQFSAKDYRFYTKLSLDLNTKNVRFL